MSGPTGKVCVQRSTLSETEGLSHHRKRASHAGVASFSVVQLIQAGLEGNTDEGKFLIAVS